MKKLAVLGSTGSIGTSTLDLVRAHPNRFRVVSLAAGRNLDRLRRQIEEHRPTVVSVADEGDADQLARDFPTVEVVSGREGLERAACHPDAGMVVTAVVGAAGLLPTLAAIRSGKDIALANKETLVIAGELVMQAVTAAGGKLLPVDSEHCALHQILGDRNTHGVDRLILTASGGPFRTWTTARMLDATVEEALAHPTWRMGRKISVDSATMMNKGLEIIEAHHLFAVPGDRIGVVIHPQSRIHALVAYRDGSHIAQLSVNDMRLPILYALAWPERLAPPAEPLDLNTIGRLEFAPPDPERFPALGLARAALAAGGEMPAVLNAANEVAVEAFLARRCSFDRIAATIDTVMERWSSINRPLRSIEQVEAADAGARRLASQALGNTDDRSRVPSS
jgi:1-deoxy-D-xylulose-5-phosphate reductoisomerase